MTDVIDGLTSHTLKHLRERWWDDDFNDFLSEALRPRPGNRILNVGCGEGIAEVSIGRRHISQVRLVGVDIIPGKVLEASRTTAAHNQRAAYAAGDARCLPFSNGAFDSVYCVAVLQHVDGVESAVAELARVTAMHGRVVGVEPDNATRYLHSSVPSGSRAFEASNRFFTALNAGRGEAGSTIGAALPSLFARHGIEPVSVRLFPVSEAILGPPTEAVWLSRRQAVARAMEQPPASSAVRDAGRDYIEALEAYHLDAVAAGPAFVEIQNTLLFATVGQRQG